MNQTNKFSWKTAITSTLVALVTMLVAREQSSLGPVVPELEEPSLQLAQMPQLAGRCCTPYFACPLYSPILWGQPCVCFTPQGPLPGRGC